MIIVPSKMGRLNTRALVAQLRRLGTASRADLAKTLNTSQPTAGRIVEELLEVGVLREVGDTRKQGHRNGDGSPRRGRPGRLVTLNDQTPRFLGIQLDVQETSLAALPVGCAAEDGWDLTVATPASAAEWASQLKTASRRLATKTLWGAVVSVPGIVDEAAGKVLFSPNLHWTETVDLCALVQRAVGLPTQLVQEERALALGQQSFQGGGEDFLLVDFGEGFGAAMVIEGRLHVSRLPLSGELGHTPVLGNQRPCGCGAVGCAETLVSRRGLLLSFAEQLSTGKATWPALARSIAADGVPPWLHDALQIAAVTIAGAVNVLGLRHVVITGGLAELGPAVTDQLCAAIVKGALWGRFGEVQCEIAPRHRTAGLVAAGLDRVVLSVARPSASGLKQ